MSVNRLVLLPAVVLAACSPSQEGSAPPPVTEAEADALEDAASMLDEQRMPVQEPAGEPEETEGESR